MKTTGDIFGKETTCGMDPSGRYIEQVRYFYGCGHCSKTVYVKATMDPYRPRCPRCSRWICQTEICTKDCTPLYSLAEDHFEKAKEWGKLVPAIMSGAETINDAKAKGIVLTDL